MAERNNIVEVMKAIGDPTRYKVLELLASFGNKLCVNAISERLGISQPVISQHLRVLKNAGVVLSERAGYHIHYSINHETITELNNNLRGLVEAPPVKCMADSCVNPNNN